MQRKTHTGPLSINRKEDTILNYTERSLCGVGPAKDLCDQLITDRSIIFHALTAKQQQMLKSVGQQRSGKSRKCSVITSGSLNVFENVQQFRKKGKYCFVVWHINDMLE